MRILLGLTLLGIAGTVGCGGDSPTESADPTANRDPILVAIERTGAGALLDKDDPKNPIYTVDLTSGRIRNKVLEALAKAKLDVPLRIVATKNKRLTSDGFVHLAGIENVKELDLTKTRVSDDDLAHISEWKHLEVLKLGQTPIGNKGVGHLTKLPLKRIDLSFTQINNSALVALQQVPTLEVIRLDGTEIDNSAAVILRRYENLKEVYATGSNLSMADATLHRRLPGVKIVR